MISVIENETELVGITEITLFTRSSVRVMTVQKKNTKELEKNLNKIYEMTKKTANNAHNTLKY